jgi:hypothetical protein
MRKGFVIRKKEWLAWTVVPLLAILFIPVRAQSPRPVKQLKVVNNVMYIIISKNLPITALDSFTLAYNVTNLGLHQLIRTGKTDSLLEAGWQVETKPSQYSISKKLGSSDKLLNPSDKIIFSAVPTPDDWREVGGNRIVYGINHFNPGREFRRAGDIVYITLHGHKRAERVRLAGSFTNWQHGAFPMKRTADGWEVPVKLLPGQHFYKFIVDNGDWMTDPDNKLSENDGRGNENSVFYIPNKTFFLKGYEHAKSVKLIGSFNNWVKNNRSNELPLLKVPGGWKLDMYLEPGTHSYEFVVDGRVVKGDEQLDDKNKSTVALGNSHLFTLKGFRNAKRVALAGNFNDWQPENTYMRKTDQGWELAYALGPGNYQYKFIVDGNWMTDPARPEAVIDDGKGNENTMLVIGANYTFKLNGFAAARQVNLVGDFNEWSERGLPMKWNGKEWTCPVYLGRGKHVYKFLIDGKWMRDPDNKLWEENKLGNGNSVIWIE